MNTGGGQESNDKAVQGASPVSVEPENGASIGQDKGQLALPLSSRRHIMRAEELDHDGNASPEIPPHAAEEMNLTLPEHTEPSFGRRLRDAREAKGLERAEIAQRLKLPLRLIGRIEEDDYSGMDQGVYLRGYLSSYARMVGVPTIAAETIAAQHMHSAPLVATGKVSRSRYLFDRYSVSATYLILTALIVVPAVWLATHGGLEQNLARTTPLDSPSTTIAVPADAQSAASDANATNPGATADSSTSTSSDAAAIVAATEPPKQEQMPVVASMAPFGSQTPNATPAPAAETHAQNGAHSLTLKLSGASWVEIVATDGSKLEYGTLPAGSERSYSSNGALSIRLGNAEGAEVTVDGKPLDLAPFRHANVARLSVFGADAPRSEF